MATLVVTELFKYFRPKHEIDKSRAEASAAAAEGDAKLIDATARMFTATVDDLRGEIKDLRDRLGRVEGEVIALRKERDHLIRENEDLRGKLDLAHGEVRQLQQVINSRARFDQEGAGEEGVVEPLLEDEGSTHA